MERNTELNQLSELYNAYVTLFDAIPSSQEELRIGIEAGYDFCINHRGYSPSDLHESIIEAQEDGRSTRDGIKAYLGQRMS